MNRKDILETAITIVTKDRATTHGDAESSFKSLAAIWSVLLGIDIKTHEVALMMVSLKMVRAMGNPSYDDNWVDLAGYAACGGEIATKGAKDV
jgi:hypothetical protein